MAKILAILQLVMLCATMCKCFPAHIAYGSGGGEVGNTHVCDDLVGKDDFETYYLRLNCERIFENEYIEWSEKMLSNETFASGLEVVDVTNLNDRSQGSANSNKREKRSADRCPSFDNEYLQKHVLPKDRSLSPWEFFVTLDRNRFPKKIIDSRCLCKGCIDIRTVTEDSANVLSVPLPITIPVKMNSELTTMDVHVGCTCQLVVAN